MKILHTSDWHLGRTFLSESMHSHQEVFVDWLLELVVVEQVELVVIAGDVYDRAVPPAESVRLFNRALVGVSALCPVFVTPGNHDSAIRLGFGSELMRANGVHIRSEISEINVPLEITGSDGTNVVVYGIPFLQPEVVFNELESERSHTGVLCAAMARVNSDLNARQGVRSVVVSHAFITGGSGSESERSLEIGGIGDAPSTVFAGVNYVAVGHLHGSQVIKSPAGSDTVVKYSGSPLPYSFSEEKHNKSVTIVEVPAVGPITYQDISTPVPGPLVTVTGELNDLLENPEFTVHEGSWVRAIVTDPVRQERTRERLLVRFPNLKHIEFTPKGGIGSLSITERLDPQAKPPIEIAAGFISHVTNGEISDSQKSLVQSAIETVNSQSVKA
jgi:DNA repair protein SbcD/Mre11